MTSLNKSTVVLHVSRGYPHIHVTMSWMSMAFPINNYATRIAVVGKEVGEAYSMGIDRILSHPELKNFKYVVTCEDDMMVPANGLLKLIKTQQQGNYDIVGSLYIMKNALEVVPMVYGDPNLGYEDTEPVEVKMGQVQEVNCCGMGFTLFKLDMFKDDRFKRPFFQTVQEADQANTRVTTQDMFFMMQARQLGYRIAVDNSVECGHFDDKTGIVYEYGDFWKRTLTGMGGVAHEVERPDVPDEG